LLSLLLKYCENDSTSDVLLMMDGVDHIDCEPMLSQITVMFEQRIGRTEPLSAKAGRLDLRLNPPFVEATFGLPLYPLNDGK
jgi:hypothetical protein